MDPAHPVRQVNDQSLTHVQRWVMSVLAATRIMHLSVGLVVAAYFINATASSIGLCVIAGALGVLALVVARITPQASLVTPWVLLGLVPAVVGVVIVLAR